MKLSALFSLLFLMSGLITDGKAKGFNIDRPAFYNAMSSDNLETINIQLKIIKESSFSEKDAYEGALLMKKAGLVNTTKEKIALFKAGRSKLEESIAKDHENTEFRFLRLIIQENAPKIVKYKFALQEDSKFISANFKNLPQFLQQVIKDYSKNSVLLKSL